MNIRVLVGVSFVKVFVDDKEFNFKISELSEDVNLKDNLYMDKNGLFYILDNEIKKAVKVKYILNYLYNERGLLW